MNINGLGAISDVRLDPEHRLLIRREKGEVIHLELRAPDAKQVEVGGDFSSPPLRARLAEGTWKLDLPLTEGRYFYYWIIDGKNQQDADGQTLFHVQDVRGLQRVNDGYPK